MSFLFSELRRITSDLHQSGINWCLVGGLGTSVYIEPRTTKDIDVVVSVSGEVQADELKDFLLSRGYVSPQLLMHSSPTRRMGWRVFIPSAKEASIPLDILVTACGIESEIVASAFTIEILPGLSLPVASLGHLVAMKVLSQNSFNRLQNKGATRAQHSKCGIQSRPPLASAQIVKPVPRADQIECFVAKGG